MNTNREVLYPTDNQQGGKIIHLAESYADSVNPCIRVASKRAFLDGYMEAMENEGMYADEAQERLSHAYSNLKVTHHELKCKMKYQRENREERHRLYLKLKEEFDGT